MKIINTIKYINKLHMFTEENPRYQNQLHSLTYHSLLHTHPLHTSRVQNQKAITHSATMRQLIMVGSINHKEPTHVSIASQGPPVVDPRHVHSRTETHQAQTYTHPPNKQTPTHPRKLTLLLPNTSAYTPGTITHPTSPPSLPPRSIQAQSPPKLYEIIKI